MTVITFIHSNKKRNNIIGRHLIKGYGFDIIVKDKTVKSLLFSQDAHGVIGALISRGLANVGSVKGGEGLVNIKRIVRRMDNYII